MAQPDHLDPLALQDRADLRAQRDRVDQQAQVDLRVDLQERPDQVELLELLGLRDLQGRPDHRALPGSQDRADQRALLDHLDLLAPADQRALLGARG